MSHSPNDIESQIGKVLLIGVTGGTGGNVVKGFLELRKLAMFISGQMQRTQINRSFETT